MCWNNGGQVMSLEAFHLERCCYKLEPEFPGHSYLKDNSSDSSIVISHCLFLLSMRLSDANTFRKWHFTSCKVRQKIWRTVLRMKMKTNIWSNGSEWYHSLSSCAVEPDWSRLVVSEFSRNCGAKFWISSQWLIVSGKSDKYRSLYHTALRHVIIRSNS